MPSPTAAATAMAARLTNRIAGAVAVAVMALTAACGGTPDGVLGREDMAMLMADIHTGEGVVDMNREEYITDSAKQVLRMAIYARHGVTPAEFDSSMAWYGRNLDEYMEMYDRTIEILEQRLAETGNRVAAEAMSIAGDSVDVWAYSRYLTFSDLSPSRFVTFGLATDENWERGDSYTWRGKFFNNGNDGYWTIVAEYTDGSMESVRNPLRADGWQEIKFVTDSSRTARRVYGMLYGVGRDATTLRIDSIELVRKRLNRETYGSRYRQRLIPRYSNPDTVTARDELPDSTASR